MAAQAAMISDTITSLKRSLQRQKEDAATDEPTTRPTNRGNKLHGNARYIHEGSLAGESGQQFYRKRIEYAGYTRDILERNPPKYDSEGDELDDEDEDDYAEAEAMEENPFADVFLETLLCPLKHPSDLATHPSMASAYTSNAIKMMVESVNERLRQERARLWKAKRLHREFLGDSPWMPCGFLEALEDRNLFEPASIAAQQQQSTLRSFTSHQSRSASSSHIGGPTQQPEDQPQDQKPEPEPMAIEDDTQDKKELPDDQQEANQDAEMPDATDEPVADGPVAEEKTPDRAPSPPREKEAEPFTAILQGQDEIKPSIDDTQSLHMDQDEDEQPEPQPQPMKDDNGGPADDNDKPPTNDDASQKEKDNRAEDDEGEHSSPEPPRRMTTRAQANASNPQPPNQSDSPGLSDATTRSGSPADTDISLLTPHPLYYLPTSPNLDRLCGLPPLEADETRRLLWSYIQKQEETVRGFARMYDMLLKSLRMKDEVWEWCKAEGHVGEMSDGEDWYDKERWGLGEGEDLKKGADEDEVDVITEETRGGKRGRRRQ
ncbi:hypothetical protein AJ80_04199 [Polytolypa hystricis UAMH7299]|uniref:Transcriptional regulatory protein RXT2 N-terminal domain-containing protein n=1 Tax=Polytolypa hystricis (strain UAMH7299) TaxID=1447883 RepID=A0A2B7YDI5_POLH7|nr:hypothetical protein AJ80_04199 [Polytolypa hystricis UAMH7299]